MTEPKTPQDRKPKATKATKAAASTDETPMPVVTLRGQEFTLTAHPQDLLRNTGTLRRLSRMDEMAGMFFLAEQMFPAAAWRVADEMSVDEFGEAFKPLLEGLDLGE